jgi:CRP-like cAMP-binding protein
MQRNILLSALPADEQQRLAPYLSRVELETGFVMAEPDEPFTYVYFPEDLVTSTLQQMEDGSSVEAGLMGVEGMAGIQVWLFAETTPAQTVVQISGHAQRMKTEDFIRHVRNTDSPLNRILGRYVHSFIVMTSQVAACNRLHDLDVRLCRWLTMIVNRINRDEFEITHEFLAQMLGVRRATVSTQLAILQRAGLIEYSRGRMRTLDRHGLRAGSCECLEIIEAQVDRFAKTHWSTPSNGRVRIAQDAVGSS